MRLLEFTHPDISADPSQSAHFAVDINDRSRAAFSRVKSTIEPVTPATADVTTPAIKVTLSAQRGPIDLENLQQRIVALEKRILSRVDNAPASQPAAELDLLKQRLLTLERNINNELWAAKQREYALLEMLARPTLRVHIEQQLNRLRTHNLPATRRWIKTASREWWQDRRPDWWTGFARAWQESLDQARGMFTSR